MILTYMMLIYRFSLATTSTASPPCQNCHRCRLTGAAAGTVAGILPEPSPESCQNHRWNLARTAVEIAAAAN
ncbi:hypothetical protein VNO80_26626 [Phaseolus coccineus]|uniref:Secreted protein n=1 Tax=Phaseolus coccineus TaxID=3886 RepID=A0AAN9LF40_PHACN